MSAHATIDAPQVYTHLETDSRKVDPYGIFFALPGVSSHGWDYLDDVVALGCRLAIVPMNISVQRDDIELIAVQDPAALLVACLHRYFGHMPAHMVAVTGTNGKSSICYYIAQLASNLGCKSGLVGTFGVGPLSSLKEATQTTPDILSLHQTLMKMSASGVDFVAFEASSHALDQGRIEGVPFQTAVFSNLSRDHLDYHGGMENYAHAKRRLFAFDSVKQSVICLDDDYADFMAAACSQSERLYYSVFNTSADFFVKDLSFDASGCRFMLCHPGGGTPVCLPLLGQFNVQNALAAVASLWQDTVDKQALIDGLSLLQGAPGRMEKVQRPNAPLAVIDYAHTPDALALALQALKAHSKNRVICVFGCGGDRDRGKRPEMMEAALKWADHVWLTSDNPRTESIEQIFADTLAGVKKEAVYSFEVDRRRAISQAILSASPDDIVLIAGKGHETYQDVQGVKHSFDDKEEALIAIEAYAN
ncbi:UDP-N-acetylmuramoyl-L-alanyl-D-glutamate--2,6-diaminopimelate ligase [Marinomonas sp. A79]|uniref:UDP-N-acetylmuramoyl-L-alanyl-D-glutamate--2,6-diaminopimelate ligase n=2 Tax=Marinomonas vulgaris TaxID=2823372 RepID=A0ABS5HDJ7_9GAMM|nr:UDP-N-acetylmuramoyl-L-alanyl-D-glutamate--2,6-diaminopimelate ligase [Marinomonas vulgaris]